MFAVRVSSPRTVGRSFCGHNVCLTHLLSSRPPKLFGSTEFVECYIFTKDPLLSFWPKSHSSINQEKYSLFFVFVQKCHVNFAPAFRVQLENCRVRRGRGSSREDTAKGHIFVIKEASSCEYEPLSGAIGLVGCTQRMQTSWHSLCVCCDSLEWLSFAAVIPQVCLLWL